MDIVWLPAGRRSRFTQLEYIAQENAAAAGRLDEEMVLQVRQLRDHPLIGRPGRRSGTRELIVARTPFIVVYRIRDTRIEILRVLHGAQRWP